MLGVIGWNWSYIGYFNYMGMLCPSELKWYSKLIWNVGWQQQINLRYSRLYQGSLLPESTRTWILWAILQCLAQTWSDAYRLPLGKGILNELFTLLRWCSATRVNMGEVETNWLLTTWEDKGLGRTGLVPKPASVMRGDRFSLFM